MHLCRSHLPHNCPLPRLCRSHIKLPHPLSAHPNWRSVAPPFLESLVTTSAPQTPGPLLFPPSPSPIAPIAKIRKDVAPVGLLFAVNLRLWIRQKYLMMWMNRMRSRVEIREKLIYFNFNIITQLIPRCIIDTWWIECNHHTKNKLVIYFRVS